MDRPTDNQGMPNPSSAALGSRTASELSPASQPASSLVRHSVRRTLFDMAFPMLAGTFAMTAYNLTDTWFVSRLGTLPLAAMGFTFPVVMLLTFVASGIGTGVTALRNQGPHPEF